MDNKGKALEALNRLGIEYELHEHPAVYTIDEVNGLGLGGNGGWCKNLFLQDGKTKGYCLVVMQQDKKADIKAIKAQIGCKNLRFADEEKLNAVLGLDKGSVTPLGVMNDKDNLVTVLIDIDLQNADRIGVHPNVNTATTWIGFDDLVKFISHYGNRIQFITI
jgi:Ala-tRNA(Pro) deacylase